LVVHLARYYSGYQTRNKKKDEVCGTYEEERNACNILVGNPMEIDQLEDLDLDGNINIKMNHKEIVWEGPD
jgi:hypothetical protein